MNANEEERKRKIREANNMRHRKFRVMKKLKKLKAADERENKLSKMSSDSSSVNADLRTVLESNDKSVSLKSNKRKENKKDSSTSETDSSDPDSSNRKTVSSAKNEHRNSSKVAQRTKSVGRVSLKKTEKSSSEEDSSSSDSTVECDSTSSISKPTSEIMGLMSQNKSLESVLAKKLKLKIITSTPKAPVRPMRTRSSSSSSSSSDQTSAKRRKLNNSVPLTPIKVLKTNSWSDSESNSMDSDSENSQPEVPEKVDTATQTNNSRSVIGDEDTEVTMLKKIRHKLTIIEGNYKTVIEMIKKVEAFQLTERDFVKKYNLQIPLKTTSDFDLFNNNLELNEQFRSDFIASVNPLIDHQMPLPRSLIDILKKYLSPILTSKFTAVKKMPNKLLFKQSEFFKCLQAIVCKTFMDRDTMKLISERKFCHHFSAAFINSKSGQSLSLNE